MEPSKIIENNKLIALFMGFKETDTKNRLLFPNASVLTIPVTELRYNVSWSWLIPVVENISNYQFPKEEGETIADTAYMRTFGMKNENNQCMVRINRFALFEANTHIEAAYLSVIDFITWYNQQPK